MRTIDEDIKNGKFKTVYLLYGEEAYLKKQYKDKLKHALCTDGDTMNASFFQGKDINSKELIDLAETMPFFADKRLIMIEDSGFFKTGEEELADYMSQIPDTTTFVFCESEVDKRSRLFKACRDSGKVVEFALQNQELLTRWILGRLKRENKNITKSAMEEFFARVGTDMGLLDREMEKLLCYTMDREVIELSDVEAVCPQAVSNKIFDMVSAIIECRRKDALEMYYDLLALKEPALRILFLITRQYRILLLLKDMKRRGVPNAQMAKEAGIPPFAVSRSLSQASRLSMESIRHILEYSVEQEEAVKIGQMNEQMAVELVIMEASRERAYQ
ncbi:MAG: DNA polymerase III subunit delta [bacterium]|nr:DNA polymerase III subunit delta [bacterium]